MTDSPTCKTCRFWDEPKCRRYPPTYTPAGHPDQMPTRDVDWCGEHQAKHQTHKPQAGHCSRPEGCVCTGDHPVIRATCQNWTPEE